MSAVFDHIKDRIFDLEQERATGTHTNECSRADLMTIASILGDRTTWSEPTFADKKREAMERFGLSGRKFSAATNAIQKSRPLAALIGVEAELRYLSDDKAVAALNLWTKAHPLKPRSSENIGLDFYDWKKSDFAEETRIACELNDAIIKLLTLEEFADIEVVFYIGRDRMMGEHYDNNLDQTLRRHRAAQCRLEPVDHIISKTNLLKSMIKGALSIGRLTLASKLRKVHLDWMNCTTSSSAS